MTDSNQGDRAARAFADAFSTHAEGQDFEPLTIPGAVAHRPSRRFSLSRLLPAAAALISVAVAGVLVLNLFPSNQAGPAARAPMSDGSTQDGSPQDEASTEPQLSRSSVPPKPGWRYESYRNLQLQVPASWGYAFSPGTDWCATTRQQVHPPYVDRVGNRATMAILCPETIEVGKLATFVTFAAGPWQAPWKLPKGWTSSSSTLAGTTATVVHPTSDADLAEQILATMTTISIDHNGCPVSSAIQGTSFKSPTPPTDLAAITRATSIAVCQYDLRSSGPGLLGSRLAADPAAVLRQLQAAPIGGGPDDAGACIASDTGQTAIVIRIAGEPTAGEVYVYYESCRNNGFFDGTSPRALTPQACIPLTGGRIWIGTGHEPSVSRCRENPGPTATKS